VSLAKFLSSQQFVILGLLIVKIKKTTSVLLVGSLITGLRLYNLVILRSQILGNYVANIENDFATSGVSHGDQLILLENQTFKSTC